MPHNMPALLVRDPFPRAGTYAIRVTQHDSTALLSTFFAKALSPLAAGALRDVGPLRRILNAPSCFFVFCCAINAPFQAGKLLTSWIGYGLNYLRYKLSMDNSLSGSR